MKKGKNMKKTYNSPEAMILLMDAEDIIRTSTLEVKNNPAGDDDSKSLSELFS